MFLKTVSNFPQLLLGPITTLYLRGEYTTRVVYSDTRLQKEISRNPRNESFSYKRQGKDEKGGWQGRREWKTMDRYDPLLSLVPFAFLPPCVTCSCTCKHQRRSLLPLYPGSVSNLKRNKIIEGKVSRVV